MSQNPFVEAVSRAFRPPAAPSAADVAAQQTAASIAQQAASAQAATPPCATGGQHVTASILCAQKRVAGHEAVAAFGRTLGATDPMAEAISLAPCEWAALPICKTDSFVAASPQAQTAAGFSKKAPPSSSSSLTPAPTPMQPTNDSRLILGGVVLGALVLGGVFMLVKKKGSSS